MHVTKSKHDLQRQRDQRQHRPVSFMAANNTHPRRHPSRPHAISDANVTMLHHAREKLSVHLCQQASALVNSRRLLRIMSIYVADGPFGDDSASE